MTSSWWVDDVDDDDVVRTVAGINTHPLADVELLSFPEAFERLDAGEVPPVITVRDRTEELFDAEDHGCGKRMFFTVTQVPGACLTTHAKDAGVRRVLAYAPRVPAEGRPVLAGVHLRKAGIDAVIDAVTLLRRMDVLSDPDIPLDELDAWLPGQEDLDRHHAELVRSLPKKRTVHHPGWRLRDIDLDQLRAWAANNSRSLLYALSNEKVARGRRIHRERLTEAAKLLGTVPSEVVGLLDLRAFLGVDARTRSVEKYRAPQQNRARGV